MKRDKRLKIFLAVTLMAYITAYVISFFVDKSGLFISKWFSFSLLIISFYMLYKVYLFGGDSSLMLGLVLLGVFIINVLDYYFGFTTLYLLLCYLAVLLISNFTLYVNKRKIFFLFIVLCLIVVFLPLFFTDF